MKQHIRKFLHGLLLPRGKKYIHDEVLHNGWDSHHIKSSFESLYILHGTKDSAPAGIVILAHPYIAEASQFYLRSGHAEMYKNLDFAVFIPDFNGFGKSPFTGFDYIRDLELTVALAKKMYPELPLFMHGISFGASHTIGFAAKDTVSLQGIIIENCLDSNLTYYKKRNYRLYMFMRSLMFMIPRANKHHNYIRTASLIRPSMRALLIYNLEDKLTTPEMGHAIFQSMQCDRTMVIMPGMHLKAINENRLLYAYAISRFVS